MLFRSRPITTNQIEIHVLLQNRPAVDLARLHGISTTAYCPLARGALTGHPVLTGVASRCGATVEQVALAFLMAEGHVVIPSSSNASRMALNFAAKDVLLSTEDVLAIRKLDEGRRLVNGAWCPVWDT